MADAETTVRVVEVETPNLAARTVDTFKAEMDQLTTPGLRLVLDLRRVTFMDSAGCGVLVALARRLRQSGGALKLCNVTPPVRALFDLVRLYLVLDLYPTREAALASIDQGG